MGCGRKKLKAGKKRSFVSLDEESKVFASSGSFADGFTCQAQALV
jgi:hypothetical protein